MALAEFLSPTQQLKQLREEALQRRLGTMQLGQQAFAQAPDAAGRFAGLGQQIGGGLSGYLTMPDEEELKQSPEYQMAINRQSLLNLDPEDKDGILEAYKKSVELNDYPAAQFALDRLDKLKLFNLKERALQTKKDAASKPDEPKPRKPWGADLREGYKKQIRGLGWVKDINDEEEEDRVANSIVSATESYWQKLRESGANIEDTTALRIITAKAKKHFQKGWLDDKFNFEGFQQDLDNFGIQASMPTQDGSDLPQVNSAEDYNELKSGQEYIDPNGVRRTKS